MTDLTAAVGSIKYKSIAAVGEQFRKLDLPPDQFGPAVGAALQLSPTKGIRMAKGILMSCTDREQGFSEAGQMIAWAGKAGSAERQVITKTMQACHGGVVLVHHISAMPRERAKEFMVDYLAAGGEMKAIAQWLQIAGGVLRKHRVKDPQTSGFVVDAVVWVADKVEDGVDAVVEAVETVVDSVIKAGKSLLDMVTEVINWTISEVADLVNALVQAGKAVAEILAAALEYGIEGLKKFVKAVIAAGKTVAEVLAWAVEQAAGVIGDVLNAMRDAAVRVGRFLEWAANQAADIANTVVQALIDIGQSVAQIIAAAAEMAYSIVKSTIQTLLTIGRALGEIVVTVFTRPWDVINATVRALLEIGHSISDLFQQVIGAVADGVKKMTQALIQIGKTIADLVSWAVDKAGEIVKEVVRGILDAGKSLLDLMASVATRVLSVVQKFVQALFELGRTFTQLMKELFALSVQALSKILRAALNLGKTIVEFVAHTITRTYRAAAKLIDAALRAGVAIAELLGQVVGKTYWVLRKMVNGIVKALGPVGKVLDWALSQAAGAADALWHKTLAAIRYAKGKLTDALDWAAKKGEQAMQAIVRAWESIEEDLLKVYEWAKNFAVAAGNAIWEVIGTITVKLENSISYVFLYLEKDFIPGMKKFIKGLLDAGAEIADLITWMASRALTTVVEVVKDLLDYGAKLADLFIETVKHPDQALQNFLAAVQAAGKTLKDIFQVAIIDTGEQFLARVVVTLNNLEKPIMDMLNAAAEVSFGAVGTIIDILLNLLASYRPLTAQEKQEAREIYGDSIDLDKIYVSVEDLANKIIFGLQDWANGTPNSRAFTTNTLINFDIDDGITRHTLIHELCHVWQALVTGPFYMSEAIHAQNWGGGYNYGYNESLGNITLVIDYDGHTKVYNLGSETGEGGQTALQAANGNFDAFNREQQAQIIMQYFVRRYLLNKPPADYADWQTYVDVVQAG